MAASITWSDNSVADGNQLTSAAVWSKWTDYGSGVPTSDEHFTHCGAANPYDQVMDMSTTGRAWAIHSTALDSPEMSVETNVWPDKSLTFSAPNMMGVIARNQEGVVSAATDINCYMAAVYGPSTGDAFSVYLWRVVDGVRTQLASTEAVGPPWSTTGKDFGLRLVVTGTGATVTCEAWVHNGTSWQKEIDYSDTDAARITTGNYSGRFFWRDWANTDGQPFSRNMYAEVASAPVVSPLATGGTVTEDDDWYYHTFIADGTFTPYDRVSAEYLVVGGGGGGGSGNNRPGGGGGAGGVVTGTGLLISSAQTITIGAGGTGGNNSAGSPGGDSSIGSLVVADGGGEGGGTGNNGGSGGSGGGGGIGGGVGGTATIGQGNNGGDGTASTTTEDRSGGGGGAGGAGSDGVSGAANGAGGPGIVWPAGGSVTYAKGGDGSTVGTPGVNYGDGGAGGDSSPPGGNGAAGVVIIRYPKPRATGGIIGYDGTDFIHTFIESGTFTPDAPIDVEHLTVAGGGGGGSGTTAAAVGGGGGGAGGMKSGTGLTISSAQTITIGAGGAGGAGGTSVVGSNGSDSSIGALVTATGGGHGGAVANGGASGGSGGGAGARSSASGDSGGSGTTGEGTDGGDRAVTGTHGGAGGGGKTVAGGDIVASADGRAGGAGGEWPTSSGTFYAGGAGGGSNGSGTGGSGGSGGGGAGGNTGGGVTGSVNTGGGGGGGAGGAITTGGDGGSGIVIIRYTIEEPPSNTVSIYFGDTQLIGMAIGDTTVIAAYLGDTQVL